MKKILITITLILLLTGCNGTMNAEIPKGYISKIEHYDTEGIQDHTDYAKYIYDKTIVENDTNYKLVQDNINNIKSYFNDFKSVMESKERLNEYDFDIDSITENDYVRIITKEGTAIGDSTYDKFDNYSVYLFDSETLTLYYIHNNI